MYSRKYHYVWSATRRRLMKLVLTLAFLLLAATAEAPVQSQPSAKVYSAFPTGQGEPDQFTCRPPQRIPDARLMGPEICKRNAEWARYRRDGMDVAPDGIHDVKLKGGDTKNSCQSTS